MKNRLFQVVKKLILGFKRPQKKQINDLLDSILGGLSGVGGFLDEVNPIHSRMLGQVFRYPNRYFVPTITTEASPRLVSLSSGDGPVRHVVVWDERYTHYVSRFIRAHEVCTRMTPCFDDSVRIFSIIAWDFVIEQLCPKNRLVRRSNAMLAKRVLANAFSSLVNTKNEDEKFLDFFMCSPVMTSSSVKEFVDIMVRVCRELALEHELNHYIRRYSDKWDSLAPISTKEVERFVLDHIAEFEFFAVDGALPRGQIWPFFNAVLGQVPFMHIRKKIEGSDLGEELQCDLIPIIFLCLEIKEAVKEGCTEAEEFKFLAFCYQQVAFWQITSVFLQGLRVEVGKSLGRSTVLNRYEENDLGIRLSLGSFMCYKILSDPPYATPSPVDGGGENPYSEQIESARRMAEMVCEKLKGRSVEKLHRSFFLDNFERSNQNFIHVLNEVGINVSDALKNFAEQDSSPSNFPRFDHYLKFLRIAKINNRYAFID